MLTTSIFMALAFFVLAMLTENFLGGGRIIQGGSFVLFPYLRGIGPHRWIIAALTALIVGASNFVVTTFAVMWLNWTIFVIMLGILIAVLAWWLRDADSWQELVVFLPLPLIIYFVFKHIGVTLAGGIASGLLMSIVAIVIPILVLIIGLGVPIAVLLWRQRSGICRIIAIILAILLAIGSVTTVALGVDWPSKGDDNSGYTGVEGENGWHFYNLDLQSDSDEDNDFNFGPNPYDEDFTAADYDNDFRGRLAKDPALGAADIAWLDANVGTRFLGEFYESCKGDWAKTINAAKTEWIENPSAYYKTLAAFFGYLNKAEVSIAAKGNNITDQMYMNPYTTDAIPDVIVMKTKQQDGPFLVYTFTIKGNTFEVEYRIPCGYQPTNVKIVMGITPQSKPSKPSGGNNSGGGDKGGGSEPTTKPEETTKKKYNKDPSQSNNSGQNDDKGPGENTNTGGNKSSKEKDSNSNNQSSYDDYRKKIDEMNDANSGNGSNNSSNNPSTGSGSGTNVDSNADKANTPTPQSDKASEINGDDSAQAWDGPAD